MPLSGSFIADFSSFTDAVAKAEVSLKSFEQGSEKVGTQLTRMTDSLSGVRIVQQATMAAEAVERIGGVSQLTEKELARVAAIASEAAAKLTAMGQDVPPGIAKIAAEAKNADTAHQGLGQTVKDLALSYVALSTARAIYDYAKALVNEASALKDVSQQTHINVEELQLLAGAMSEFGVDTDELGKGLFKLSRGIAGGDESVSHGLALMGIALKDVEGLNGKELFLKIEGGLATLQGGLRDTAAAELFGGKLGAAMAGASEGIEGALEKWQRLNTVASIESVDALDAYGESIERASKSLNAMATNVMGKSAEMFNVVTDAVEKGGGKWATFWALTKDVAAQLTMTGTGTENMTRLLDGLNQKTDANVVANKKAADAHGEVAKAIDTRTSAERFMATLEANAAGTLDAAQVKNLEHLKEIGALNAKNAEGIGVTTAQFAKYVANVEAATKAAADLKRTTEEARKLEAAGLLELTKLQEQYAVTAIERSGTRSEIEIAKINATFTVLKASLEKSRTFNDEVAAQFYQDWHQALDGVGVDFAAMKTYSVSNLQDIATRAQLTYTEATRGSAGMSREGIDHFRALRDEAVNDLHSTQEEQDKTFTEMRDHVDRTSLKFRGWWSNMATDSQKAEIGMDRFGHATEGTGHAAKLSDTEIQAMLNAAGSGAAALADKLNVIRDQFGDITDAAKELKRTMGGSQDVTFQNFGQSIGDIITGMTGGGAVGGIQIQHGVDTAAAFALAKQGYSFQEIVNALAKGMPLSATPIGPRIPGFAGGGLVTVGEEGSEVVRLPFGSEVFPHGQQPPGFAGGGLVGGTPTSGGGDPWAAAVAWAEADAKALALQINLLSAEIALKTTGAAIGPVADKINAMTAQIAALTSAASIAPAEAQAQIQVEILALSKTLADLQQHAAADLFSQTAAMKTLLVSLQAQAAHDAAVVAEHAAVAAMTAATVTEDAGTQLLLAATGLQLAGDRFLKGETGVTFAAGAIVIQGSVVAEKDLIARLKTSLQQTIMQGQKLSA